MRNRKKFLNLQIGCGAKLLSQPKTEVSGNDDQPRNCQYPSRMVDVRALQIVAHLQTRHQKISSPTSQKETKKKKEIENRHIRKRGLRHDHLLMGMGSKNKSRERGQDRVKIRREKPPERDIS